MVFQPVGSKIGLMSVVLHAGVPKVSMQRPWANTDSGAPAAAIPNACSALRRECIMTWFLLACRA